MVALRYCDPHTMVRAHVAVGTLAYLGTFDHNAPRTLKMVALDDADEIGDSVLSHFDRLLSRPRERPLQV